MNSIASGSSYSSVPGRSNWSLFFLGAVISRFLRYCRLPRTLSASARRRSKSDESVGIFLKTLCLGGVIIFIPSGSSSLNGPGRSI